MFQQASLARHVSTTLAVPTSEARRQGATGARSDPQWIGDCDL